MSHEIGRQLLARTILGEPVVIYRTADDVPIVLEDRCLHRRLPLSKGRLIGDVVQCSYHGLEYDASGTCIRIPGQAEVPAGTPLKSYAVAECQGWVVAWFGNAAERPPPPDFATFADDREWRILRGLLPIRCNHLLVLDNLLDLSHLAYVHGTITGNVAVAEEAAVETVATEDRVRVTRVMTDVAPAMLYAEYGPFGAAAINRWQVTEFIAPCFYLINNGSEAATRTAPSAARVAGQGDWGFQVYHGITPETETTTHQFWQIAYPRRNVGANEMPRFDELLVKVLDEDLGVYEAQQRSIEQLGDAGRSGAVDPAITLHADAGLNHARRILDRLTAGKIAAAP